MNDKPTRASIERALADGSGLLRLAPAWVARNTVPPGRRLGLPEEAYDRGERGWICERWLGSCTRAENAGDVPDEGLSWLAQDGQPCCTLLDALAVAAPAILGEERASQSSTLGYLAKIFDCEDRLPYHLHPKAEHASLVGKSPKEEAYYFPADVPLGKHPETFFGVHPYIVAEERYDLLLPYLLSWDSADILKHSRAYLQVPDEGFHVPSGILHAPGTALTIELQEESDIGVTFQALNAGRILPKARLSKNVRPGDWAKEGERYVLRMVDWQLNGDPYFYENRHLSPQVRAEQPGGAEHWVFYNSDKFSGSKLVVKPGQSFVTQDNGAYGVFAWRGQGRYGGRAVEGNVPGRDELVVSHAVATKPLLVENTGDGDLVVLKFFGGGLNPEAPRIGGSSAM